MSDDRKPMIVLFAGPNGSGKSTVTSLASIVGEYINADDIVKDLRISNIEAARIATQRRYTLIDEEKNFTFETVLSSSVNMDLLKYAKSRGYFVKCFYVLTKNPIINVYRVANRVKSGGHDVPVDKIISRYRSCLDQLPSIVNICDVIHIYDNSDELTRIYKKKKEECYIFENELWSREEILKLVR